MPANSFFAGAQFDPTGQYFYTVNRVADRIERYSAMNGQLFDWYVTGDDLDSGLVLKMSADGTYLAALVPGGVRLLVIPSPGVATVLLGAVMLRTFRRSRQG
jgi:hypothetical protein